MYPDDIRVIITWRRVESSGCVDRYVPVGTANYVLSIPGALCRQSIEPDEAPVTPAAGSLVVDRTTDPATYQGRGSTTWELTWKCVQDDGATVTRTFSAGQLWFEAEGVVMGETISGTRVEEDGTLCGNAAAAKPCTYRWDFTAGSP